MTPTLPNPAESERATRQRVLFQAALVTCIPNGVLAVLAARIGTPLIFGLVLAHSLLAAVITVAASHKRRSQRWLTAADATLFVPYYFTIWFARDYLANVAYDPLFASKLLAVGLAAFIPSSFRLHLALMAGLVVQAAAIWLSLSRHAAISSAEPWVTALFFLVAGWFLLARWQQHEFEKELEELRVKTAAMTQVARTFVAVRHLASTPLQKLALLTSMLRKGAPASPERIAALERSVTELEELLDEFRLYEDLVEQTEEELNLDAYAKLVKMRESVAYPLKSRHPSRGAGP